MTFSETGVKELGTLLVYDETGQSFELSGLWKSSPAALVFVRHFG